MIPMIVKTMLHDPTQDRTFFRLLGSGLKTIAKIIVVASPVFSSFLALQVFEMSKLAIQQSVSSQPTPEPIHPFHHNYEGFNLLDKYQISLGFNLGIGLTMPILLYKIFARILN